jgi:hypothetical protein
MTSHRAREAEIGEILARVEAATGPSIELDKLLSEAFGDKNDHGVLIVAGRWLGIVPLSGSIDAVLALVERVLPGWSWKVVSEPAGLNRYCAVLRNSGKLSDVAEAFVASHRTASLAILSALLLALSHTQEPGRNG